MASQQPAQYFATELLLRAQDVKVLFLDVDGVLTDGGLYYTDCAPGDVRGAAETIKRFNTLDGYGIRLLLRAGVEPVVVTGRDSRSLRARLAALGVERAHFGVDNKRAVARQSLDEMGLDWSHAAAIGDDWPDLGMMRACTFCAAPANAHAEVKAVAHYVTARRGGDGAVRELADLLLMASGRYAFLLEAEGK